MNIKYLLREYIEGEIVYHGGDIEGEIRPPFYVTPNDWAAEQYGDKVYEFLIKPNAKILDLTNRETFKNIKKKIFDNNSKLFPKYKQYGGFSGYSKESMLEDYKILKQFKNYSEIEQRYQEIKNSNLFNNLFELGFRGTSNDIDELYDYYKKTSNQNDIQLIDEFLVLYNVIRNIDRLDDYSLNEFGYYFYDYAKSHDYDAYKAWSTDPTGQIRIIEYCVINVKILKLL